MRADPRARDLRRNLERMKENNVFRAIMVVQQGTTSFAKQVKNTHAPLVGPIACSSTNPVVRLRV